MTQPGEDEHPGYMTAKDVARIYGVTIGYVYKVACLKRWRRYTLEGKTRYHRDDVDEALGKDPHKPEKIGARRS